MVTLGRLVNSDTWETSNSDGKLVNSDGKLVNSDGNLVNIDG